MADWNPGDVVAVRAEYRDRLVRSDASQTHAMVRIDDTHDLATATWAVPLDALTTYLPAAAVADLVALVAAAQTISDPMVAQGGGDRWWDAHDALRAAETDCLRHPEIVALL